VGDGSGFAERFAFAALGDGGVVLDRATGTFHKLNASAAALLAGVDEADDAVAARLGVGADRVRADRAALIDALVTAEGWTAAHGLVARASNAGFPFAAAAPSDPASGAPSLGNPPYGQISGAPPHTPAVAAAFALVWDGVPIATVSADGRTIDAVGGPVERRIAVPHALALRGIAVLHASAVLTDRGIVAFVGPGGIGKTTLARAIGGVIAEDLLVIRDTAARMDAEFLIDAWADGTDTAFELEDGPAAPVAAIHLVEGRAGREFRSERLDPRDAAGRLLTNAFAEIGTPAVWDVAFACAVKLAGAVPVFDTTLPDGLEGLEGALAAWDWRSAC
jgi:hypothetical protein